MAGPVDHLVFQEEPFDVVRSARFHLGVADLLELGVTLRTDLDWMVGVALERETVGLPILGAMLWARPPATVAVLLVEDRIQSRRVRVDELLDVDRLPPRDTIDGSAGDLYLALDVLVLESSQHCRDAVERLVVLFVLEK